MNRKTISVSIPIPVLIPDKLLRNWNCDSLGIRIGTSLDSIDTQESMFLSKRLRDSFVLAPTALRSFTVPFRDKFSLQST